MSFLTILFLARIDIFLASQFNIFLGRNENSRWETVHTLDIKTVDLLSWSREIVVLQFQLETYICL
jgi:hypothetical protein